MSSAAAADARASGAASAIIREGSATIDFGTANEVFYNKVQVLNRDLSIQMITAFAEVRKEEKMAQRKRNPAKYRREVHAKHGVAQDEVDLEKWSDRRDGIDVLEALSATGLRSVRYAKECVGIKRIVANDLDQKAADAIERNVLANGLQVSATEESEWPPVEVSCADASMLMYTHRKTDEQFDVVDLDPYGSAAPFLDSAVQAVADGGLLCITCTDSAVLCGNHSEVCFAKYGSVALRNKYCHEMGLRVLLSSVEGHANRYGRHIVPVAAFSIDFYVRVFLRVRESKLEVKQVSLFYLPFTFCANPAHNLTSSRFQPMGPVRRQARDGVSVGGNGFVLLAAPGSPDRPQARAGKLRRWRSPSAARLQRCAAGDASSR